MLKISLNFAWYLTTTALFSISSSIASNANGTYDEGAAFQEALRRSTISYDEDAAVQEALRLSQPLASSAPGAHAAPVAAQKPISAATQNAVFTSKAEEKARRDAAILARIKERIINGKPKAPVAAPSAPIVAPEPVLVHPAAPKLTAVPAPVIEPDLSRAGFPKPQFPKGFFLEEDKAISLVKYILGQRSQLRTSMIYAVENLEFMEGNFGCFQALPKLEEKSLMLLSLERVKSYSEEKGIPGFIAHDLLSYFLSPERANVQMFDEAYAQLKAIMEGQKFKDEALPALLKATFQEAGSFEEAEKNVPHALATLEKFKVTSFYTDLKKISENFGNLLQKITREEFLDDSGMRPHILKKAPENNLPGDEVLPVRQSKLFKMDVPREPLPEKMNTLQTSLNREFEERQKNNHNETVMAYGSIVCPRYHGELQENLDFLFQRMKFKEPKGFVKIQEIIDFFDKVSKDLGHGLEHRNNIMKALTISLGHQMKPGEGIVFATPEKSLKPQTEYQYMMAVASQFHRVYMTFKDEEEVKDILGNLLQTFFVTLSDQSDKCQAGMIGRMLMVQKTLLDELVDLYNKGLRF